MAGLLAAGLAACGENEPAPTASPSASAPSARTASAVLITLDTTRADVLGCYGGEAETPNLDRIAAEGVTYDAAYTSAPITLPAHASMFTGLYPPRHTVRDNGLTPLPPAAHTLAELAREAGLDTAAFVGAVVLERTFGLDQGFDHYDLPERAALSSGSEFAERKAGAVVDAAVSWLEQRDPERDVFLWVHFFDPHIPYVPPDVDLERAGMVDSRILYRGEVAYVDREIGRLLDALERTGVLPDATVMVVGDHGEAFGEHGERTHGFFCYTPTLRIPFLLRHRDGRRAGERSDAVVSVVDVFPTLAHAMGLGVPAGTDGVDLVGGDVPDARGVYFESYTGNISYGWSPIVGWLDGRQKYIHTSTPEVYELTTDPYEELNRIEDRGEVARRFQGEIAAVAGAETLPRGDAVEDEELLSAIRGLGYTSSGAAADELPRPLAPVDAPSPASMVELHYRTLEAIQVLDNGNAPMAEVMLKRVLREEPRNFLAQGRLGLALMRQGKLEEALPLLERLVEEGPVWPGPRFNLGLCLFDLGRRDEGIALVEQAIELDPSQPHFVNAAASLLQQAGRTQEAQRYREQLQRMLGGR